MKDDAAGVGPVDAPVRPLLGQWHAPAGCVSSTELGGALDAARRALPEFSQQDDYLLAHGASLMSEDSHEILHCDTLRRIVAAAVAAERERCAALLERGVDLGGLQGAPEWQHYSAQLLTACATLIRGPNAELTGADRRPG